MSRVDLRRLARRFAILIPVAGSVAIAWPASPAVAASRMCAGVVNPPHIAAQYITAHGRVTCAQARKIALAFISESGTCGLRVNSPPCLISGFRCAEPKDASGLASHPVVCRRRGGRVDFEEAQGDNVGPNPGGSPVP